MAWFRKEKKPKEPTEDKRVAIPEGLWVKCDECKEIVYKKEVEQNLNVCPKCGYHFRLTARERFQILFDDGAYKEFATNIRSADPLEFRDTKRYRDRLKVYEQRVGKGDAVLCAEGKLDGLSVVICAMEYAFMPKWKYWANLFLTMVENATFYVFLSEYHSGFRAYSRRYLESVHFEANSDDFVFDTEIIAQGVASRMLIREVPIRTRYFDEASQIGFWRSVRYGLEILKTMFFYKLHKKHIWSHPIFRSRSGVASTTAAAAQPSR